MSKKPYVKVLFFGCASLLFAAYLFREFIVSRELSDKLRILRLIKFEMNPVTRREEKKVDKKEEKKDEKKEEIKNGNNTESQLIQMSKIWRVQQDNLPLCPEKPPNLKGKIDVDMRSIKIEEIEAEYKDLMPGGHWRPKECKSRQKVAIVVPYRNREPHLRTFLHNMHRFLQKQQLDYAIFVVEQVGDLIFNKGRLTNIGVLEAIRVYPFDCIVFNDVDTYPENDNLLYTCSSNPRHFSVYLEKTGYKEFYPGFVGGVLALTVEQLRKINGYSNDFWGWGGEDDDINKRVEIAKMSFSRIKSDISRFKSFKHGSDKGNEAHPCRFTLLKYTKDKYLTDGFSNLNYRVESINYGKLYTHIMVGIE
uniref:Beta-1,4-N-acetylgalactosaminyltransferase n=1 Tax=Meloidogyne hapla TaxID=6305 RepID=A0A1I8BYK8_MELHA